MIRDKAVVPGTPERKGMNAVSGPRVSIEESVRVALILTVCGGYLDAFTWLAHDRVLANAQTANVVLFGVYAAAGEWGEAFNYLFRRSLPSSSA